jgi:Kdo2-lipid IVA lauroyltransferase/acyltransferase
MMMKWLFQLFGLLPLRLNHMIGSVIGLIAGLFSARHRQTTRLNLARYVSVLPEANTAHFVRNAFIEQGKGITELILAWTAPIKRLEKLFQPCREWHLVESAKAENRPIIFVTPHLGCYDIAGRYVASRVPITALYRPPKQLWLEPLMEAGRARGGATTAPADASGVRALLKTLKQGGNIMILPDQVPAAEKGGEGVWAPFLGKPAFTMTLLPRLAQTSNAIVLFFFAERLPRGKGYLVHLVQMAEPYSTDKAIAAAQTNAMVEKLIHMAPAQYLWGYNRFKQPAGAPPPPSPPDTADIPEAAPE